MSDEHVTCSTPLPDPVDVYTECESCADLRAQLAAARGEILEVSRICDTPGCIAAVVRRDDGSRVCAQRHEQRWVDKADLAAAETKTIEQVLYDGGITSIGCGFKDNAEAVDQTIHALRYREAECEKLRAELSGKAGELEKVITERDEYANIVGRAYFRTYGAELDGDEAEIVLIEQACQRLSGDASRLAELDESRAREAALREVLQEIATFGAVSEVHMDESNDPRDLSAVKKIAALALATPSPAVCTCPEWVTNPPEGYWEGYAGYEAQRRVSAEQQRCPVHSIRTSSPAAKRAKAMQRVVAAAARMANEPIRCSDELLDALEALAALEKEAGNA